jgi:hypothetical protein
MKQRRSLRTKMRRKEFLVDQNMQKKTSGINDSKSINDLKPKIHRHEGFFDWYLEYDELKRYFEKIYPIRREDKILMVGCGNSSSLDNLFLISRIE